MSTSSHDAPSRIGLFGGSFNPPHISHAMVTLWALETQPLDEVWWIPTFEHAFAKELVDFSHRFHMCELAIRHLRQVRVSDIEREMGRESRTIDTVRVLQERLPTTRFALIVGSDILDETHRWKDWDGLMQLVDLVVVGRTGLGDADADRATLRMPEVSSTKIRDALARGDYDEIESFVGRDVIDFIKTNHLYSHHQETET